MGVHVYFNLYYRNKYPLNINFRFINKKINMTLNVSTARSPLFSIVICVLDFTFNLYWTHWACQTRPQIVIHTRALIVWRSFTLSNANLERTLEGSGTVWAILLTFWGRLRIHLPMVFPFVVTLTNMFSLTYIHTKRPCIEWCIVRNLRNLF